MSRKSEESIIVDGFNNPQRELKVTVLEIKGGRVKLAFEVNAGAPIHHARAWTQLINETNPVHAPGTPSGFDA
ncbi:MAG: carbon storage regulator [Planctomycetes bacterium]|nr:carbon storage regulator [Planctomycetota bacterium]